MDLGDSYPADAARLTRHGVTYPAAFSERIAMPAGEAVKADEPEVPAALRDLAGVAGQLQNTAEKLTAMRAQLNDRLRPIMRPELPMEAPAAAALILEAPVEVAERILDLVNVLLAVDAHLTVELAHLGQMAVRAQV